MSNMLVIMGHPMDDSYCASVADKYTEGLESVGHETRRYDLGNLQFNPILEKAYKEDQELESGIQEIQQAIKWADHITFVYPMWWASPPAIVKGLIERTLLPGYAFEFTKRTLKWEKYLTNKTARLIVTMDTPPWYYKLKVGDPNYKLMKDILTFCGVQNVKKNYFGSIKTSSLEKREHWLEQVYDIGQKE